MPVTRTSLAAAALVAVANRCSASRLCWANRSSTCRSTAGRHAELTTVGTAKTASSTSSGIDAGQQHDRDDRPVRSSRSCPAATRTCGPARRPGCGAPPAGRDSPGAPGAPVPTPTPAGWRRGSRARSSPGRGTDGSVAWQAPGAARSESPRPPSPPAWRTAGPHCPPSSASAISFSHRANSASGTACSKVSVTTTTTSRGSWV